MLLKIQFIFFIVAFAYNAFAQESASISGYITDAGSGETLISANVALEGTPKGTSSNTSGYYSITNIPAGTYTLITSYIGYRQFSKEVTLAEGENLRLDIQLIPEGYRLEELVVESEAEKKDQKNIGVAQIQTELIKKIPSVFQADVFRSIQLLPGVKASSDFSSGLYIRGGSPDQTLILLDRTTVYNPTHFFGFFSTFNPDAVKDVRLYKGGYPAKYGGRLGSVLTIFNKDGNRNEFSGSATLGMLASRVLIEGPYAKGSYMLAVRRSTLEPILAALRGSFDGIPDKFYFLDLNGKVNYDADPNNKFSLAFYSGSDNVVVPFADDARINLNYGNQTLSGNWSHIFSERVFGNLTLTGSRYFNFPTFSIATTPFKRSNNIYDFSVKGDLEYLAGENHEVAAGFWGGSLTLNLKDEFDRNETFRSRIKTSYTSWYLQDTWQLSSKWQFQPGVRVNTFSEGKFVRVEPRISWEFEPVEDLRFQAAYGRYNQFLTLITNEAFSGFDVWLTTNNNVPPAFGDQFVIGTKTKPWQGYGIDIEIYYRTMEDLFELDPFLPDPAGLDYAELFRFGTGYAYGTELLFEKQVGRLTGFLGYTFSVTRRKFPDFNEPIGGTQARFYPPKYDRSHDINLVVEYKLGRRWKSNIVFNYASGQAYTKPLGRAIAVDSPFSRSGSSGTVVDQVIVGKVNASRLPAYHRLDLAFTRAGTFFGAGEAEWQFQIINLYSRRNIWFYNYDLDFPVSREPVQLLPVLPSVSYTINF